MTSIGPEKADTAQDPTLESEVATATDDRSSSVETEGCVIQCSGLSHEYTSQGRRSRLRPWRSRESAPTVSALQNVSLQVCRGEVVGIAGPSGSGKSTLLHLVAGLTTPTAGRIELSGTDITTCSERERTRLRHEHIGIVFQRFHLLPSLSARANVALPLVQEGMPRSTRRERATSLLARVGLEDRESHTPGTLSGGEQQRVAIARALATDPDILLADEPTGELDTATGRQVLDVMTDVAADRAVVIASHDDDALSITDRVVRLHDGQIVRDGTE